MPRRVFLATERAERCCGVSQAFGDFVCVEAATPYFDDGFTDDWGDGGFKNVFFAFLKEVWSKVDPGFLVDSWGFVS